MHRMVRHRAIASILAALLLTVAGTAAVEARTRRMQTQGAGDNSKQNSQLIRGAALTAQDQPNDRSDRQTAARLRKIIVADHALSMYAHNVKIIVASGKVTLEGPVHDAAEHDLLLADAASIVSAQTIVDRITAPTK